MKPRVLSPVVKPIRRNDRPHPDMTRGPEADLPELSLDGFNNRDADPGLRVLEQDPGSDTSPVAMHPQNLDVFPLSVPRPAVAYHHEVAVSEVRSLATPEILNVLGLKEPLPGSVPLMGLATRIVQAIICSVMGAEPYDCPDTAGWDVRTTSLDYFPTASKVFPDYTPIYIPSDLSNKAAAALVSLMVPGGAAAYGWRFNDSTGCLSDYMPSYVRFSHPGGTLKVLAVYARPPAVCVYGGKTLLPAALLHLEGYYRARWGNGYWEQAYKTIAAMGAVYANPVPASLSLGRDCPVFKQSTKQGTQDISRHTTQWVPVRTVSQMHKDHGCWCVPWRNDHTIPPDLEKLAMKALESMWNVRFSSDVSLRWDWVQRSVQADWTVDGHQWSLSQLICKCLDQVATMPVQMDQSVRLKAKLISAQYRMHSLYDRYPDSMRSPVIDSGVREGFRNIFGFSDERAYLVLPNFDLQHTVALITGVLKPVLTLPTESLINRPRLRDWLGCYCLRLHIAHNICLTDRHMWPDDLYIAPLDHHDLVKHLPEGLQSLVWVSNVRRGMIPARNWQLLEPIHFLRDCDKVTAYYGYDVCGTVELASSQTPKTIRVTSSRTNYAALDSALRHHWLKGGTISLNMGVQHVFAAIVDKNNVPAPFAISPYVFDEAEDRVLPVTIQFNTDEAVFRSNQIVRPAY